MCCKDIEPKVAGESTSSSGVSWLSDSFDSAKEDAIGSTKTIGRPRDPKDEIGGRLCHRRVCLIFLEYLKKVFKATWFDIF